MIINGAKVKIFTQSEFAKSRGWCKYFNVKFCSNLIINMIILKNVFLQPIC